MIFGDCRFVLGHRTQPTTPNPQTPIPNPLSPIPIINNKEKKIKLNKNKSKF